jgi:hypothetical protein
LGNPIDLRADKALPRKSGHRPLMGRRRPRVGRALDEVFLCFNKICVFTCLDIKRAIEKRAKKN